MMPELSETIVGPGSLGTALVRALAASGVRVAEIVYRSAGSGKIAKRLAREVGGEAVGFEAFVRSRSFAPHDRQEYLSHTRRARVPSQTLVWLCVGDSEIASTAAAMAERGSWRGAIVFHSSGALASDELDSLRRAGAKVASVHPMMTFVRSVAPSMKGVAFALEGDARAKTVARGLVKKLGGESFEIEKRDKALYHALGAFVSPLMIAQMSMVERIGRELGLKAQQTRKIIAPILRRTIRNYLERGPAAAFSGPIVRGDAETVRRNLKALKRVRGAAEIYRSLAKVAVEELPSKDAAAVKKALKSIQ